MKCCKHCKDSQIVLKSNDLLSSDIDVVELCKEIIAFYRRLKREENYLQAILQYICVKIN